MKFLLSALIFFSFAGFARADDSFKTDEYKCVTVRQNNQATVVKCETPTAICYEMYRLSGDFSCSISCVKK